MPASHAIGVALHWLDGDILQLAHIHAVFLIEHPSGHLLTGIVVEGILVFQVLQGLRREVGLDIGNVKGIGITIEAPAIEPLDEGLALVGSLRLDAESHKHEQ